jgi:hypothetical protein
MAYIRPRCHITNNPKIKVFLFGSQTLSCKNVHNILHLLD